MVSVAFITGVNGQDGSYLAELLLEKGYFVYGMIRRMSLINTERMDGFLSHPRFTYNYGDVTDSSNLYHLLSTMIQKHRSDNSIFEVYHLAAQSHVKISFEIPEYTMEVDAMGTLRLLDVCRNLKDAFQLSSFQLKIYNACTSEMFGDALTTPQNEDTPFNPRSPYAIAKQCSYYTAKNYREAYGMFVCNGILFNHESPRRGFNFITRKVTLGIAKQLQGDLTPLKIGNLDASRDWGHAKDFVRAMYLMLQSDEPKDYVIATGETHTVREWVVKAFALKGITLTWKGHQGSLEEVGVDNEGRIRIEVDPKYYRPTEVPYLLGDASKARKELGWCPEYTFEDLLKEMVGADLQSVTLESDVKTSRTGDEDCKNNVE